MHIEAMKITTGYLHVLFTAPLSYSSNFVDLTAAVPCAVSYTARCCYEYMLPRWHAYEDLWWSSSMHNTLSHTHEKGTRTGLQLLVYCWMTPATSTCTRMAVICKPGKQKKYDISIKFWTSMIAFQGSGAILPRIMPKVSWHTCQ